MEAIAQLVERQIVDLKAWDRAPLVSPNDIMKDLRKIEKIIQEELSISQDVLNIASSIVEDIKNGLKQIKGTPLNDNKKIYYRKLNLKSAILDKNVYINVDHYNFHDSNVKTNSNIDIETSLSSSGAINIIQITCYSISGKLVENKLLDSLFRQPHLPKGGCLSKE